MRRRGQGKVSDRPCSSARVISLSGVVDRGDADPLTPLKGVIGLDAEVKPSVVGTRIVSEQTRRWLALLSLRVWPAPNLRPEWDRTSDESAVCEYADSGVLLMLDMDPDRDDDDIESGENADGNSSVVTCKGWPVADVRRVDGDGTVTGARFGAPGPAARSRDKVGGARLVG